MCLWRMILPYCSRDLGRESDGVLVVAGLKLYTNLCFELSHESRLLMLEAHWLGIPAPPRPRKF
jgi:hypothetical protein